MRAQCKGSSLVCFFGWAFFSGHGVRRVLLVLLRIVVNKFSCVAVFLPSAAARSSCTNLTRGNHCTIEVSFFPYGLPWPERRET